MATPYSWIDEFPAQITAEEYEALPEEFCRTIEVIDGHILKCESPSRLHNRVARKMAVTFEENRKPEPCLMVDTEHRRAHHRRAAERPPAGRHRLPPYP